MNLSSSQRSTLTQTAVGLLLIACAAFLAPGYKLLYNPSDSAPRGWYVFRSHAHVHVGEYALVNLPDRVARLAAERGYLPRSVPLLKHIAALSGQEVCRYHDLVLIDGIAVTHALTRDGPGRNLPIWTGCRTLTAGEVFLLSTDSPLSFDGRYFGPIPKRDVLGKALPLWTR